MVRAPNDPAGAVGPASPRPLIALRHAVGRVVNRAGNRLARATSEQHRSEEERLSRELQTVTADAAAQVRALEVRVAAAEATITDLTSTITALKSTVEPLELPGLRAAGMAANGVAALGHPLDVAVARARVQAGLAGATAPPPVRLPTDLGPLLYPSRDEVVMPWVRHHGSWEPEEMARIRELLPRGGTFIDVGAHVGYVSITAARAVGDEGHGIAIEPAPENFGLLTANLASAGVPWVTAIHAAAGATTGMIELGLSEENSGDHRAVALGRSKSLPVPLVRLDDILPEDHRVDLVKTDTQGTDHRVINGLERTIAKWRPALVLEYWPEGIRDAGDDPHEVASTYLALGYNVTSLDVTLPANATAADMVMAADANRGGYCTLVLTP